VTAEHCRTLTWTAPSACSGPEVGLGTRGAAECSSHQISRKPISGGRVEALRSLRGFVDIDLGSATASFDGLSAIASENLAEGFWEDNFQYPNSRFRPYIDIRGGDAGRRRKQDVYLRWLSRQRDG
jgi:hypothetical protein